MIIIGNSFLYFLSVLVVFYILRRRHRKDGTPAFIDGFFSFFWPYIVIFYIFYYIFKFVDNLARK